ncbi:MAG: Flp pilus assembly complex ATPase component TadA [Ideonella sp.]|nr:Flp pilus assembly complex ATPase component TadA [Ideonella sp.]MCC7457397.1 Flp pilus assembly complex ATPase component TadA [Nitrospira sp.]
MSDLSRPSQALLSKESPAPSQRIAFAWPTPPFAPYPAKTVLTAPEACVIEGSNGSLTAGHLVKLDLAAGIAHVLVAPARRSMPLRFTQFRRLTLIEPLAPDPAAGAEPHADLVAHRPTLSLKLRYADGGTLDDQTVGHVEHDAGVYFFTPVDAAGRVRRHFVPRAALQGFEIGPRIGEVLVQQHAATEQQVAAALDEQQSMRSRKLGDILLTQQVVSPEQLLAAIEQQSKMPMVRIGEALLALGFISEAQLQAALEQQKQDRGVPLGELLVREGRVSREDLQTALARKMGYPIVDVEAFPVAAEAVQRVPLALARRLNALPLLMRGERLVVALEDPSAAAALDELEFAAQAKVVPTLARSGTLAGAIDAVYQRLGYDVWGAAGTADPGQAIEFEADDASLLLASLEQQQSSTETHDDDGAQVEQSDNSLVRLINSMIVEAQAQGVSDIHIETQPGRDKVRVRFRKDGVLKPYLELPHTYRNALIARLKIMCDLDISERRKPQDGKIAFGRFVPGHKLELRLVTIPTANGLEDAVLRLLASARALPLDAMGLTADNLARLRGAIERPYGMVLCVGPTGSGKTTTLHAALGHINTPERKIWTAEDPVEITQPGLRQVQVNPKIDWTFAKALRSFLRADPDVVMVGEIRDEETAQTAVEASLTGHLVLSTLHTNSAPETVTRLLDMGMDPFNFADSLLAVLAQRLVRKLCTHCRTARPLTADEENELLDDWLQAFDPEMAPARADVLARWRSAYGEQGRLLHHSASGCGRCDRTGFKGRAGLHELMTVDRELRRLIQTHARAEDLLRSALAAGMRTLRQDGIEKVLAGLTTIEEVRATSNV